MTCAINKIAALAGLASFLCVTAYAGVPAFTPTREITSNNMFSLAGRGDTLCMITDGGVNYTFATSDSLSWYGYKTDLFSGAISFGDATLAAALKSASQNVTPTSSVFTNQVWLFHFPASVSGMLDAQNVTVVDSIFSRGNHLGALAHDADFSVVDVAWTKGAFWLACTDGGLVRLDIPSGALKAFFPGQSTGFPPSKITDSTVISRKDLGNFPDTTKRVIALAVQDSSAATPVVWAVTPSKIWKFSYADSSWDSAPAVLADPTLTFVQYCAAWARTSGDTSGLFASMAVRAARGASAGAALDTMFFKFNRLKNSWTSYLQKAPFSLTFGLGGTLYVNSQNYVSLYKEVIDSDKIAISGDNDGTKFFKRMTGAADGNYPDNVNGIMFLPQPNGADALWIASSANVLPSVKNGMFYSYDELADEQGGVPFKYIHSDKKLTGGLKQTYAFPSILNSLNGSKAMFAYNLSKASKVTIRIYDWNMDLVRTVINNKDRPAGNDQANGRSTNPAEDTWDGTTDSGRRVAVGVYYYKITAQSGERAFGKIIVAK